MKKFKKDKFVKDLSEQQWEIVYFFGDSPNSKWEIWKNLFVEILDKHAPFHHRKVKAKQTPWITNTIKELIYLRDNSKRKAIISALKMIRLTTRN